MCFRWCSGNARRLQLCCCSVAQSYPTLRPHGLQHTRLPCPSPTPRACSNSCPLSWWCHATISPSVVPFSFLQSFPASGSFLMSWLFTSGSQSTGPSASASVLPMNVQDWFPLGLTGLISLQSKGLSRVFPSTTFQKHQFGEGNGNPLKYSCLEKSMDRGAWRAAVHRVTWLSTHAWGWREIGWSNKMVKLW